MATGYIMLDTPNPYTPQGGLPRRSGFKPTGTCIVHTSEGAWSAGVDSLTNLVRSRTDYGCYHRACDWQDVALYYPWEWECWQDSETNNWAVGIAAACRTEDWGNMPADVEDGFYRNMGRMAADFVTYMRDTYGVDVPLVRITGAQARAGVPGFCAHGDSGISRTDPGARFDWARFFSYTNQALGGLAAQGAVTEEDELSQAEVDQLWKLMDTRAAQVQEAVIRDLKSVASGIPVGVWSYANPALGGGDAFQHVRDAVANTEGLAQAMAAVAAREASAGATEEQITAAVLKAFQDGVHVDVTVNGGQ